MILIIIIIIIIIIYLFFVVVCMNQTHTELCNMGHLLVVCETSINTHYVFSL